MNIHYNRIGGDAERVGSEAVKWSAFYRIVIRKINHQHIFEYASDYAFFLKVLSKLKVEFVIN